jgi:AcrR family transcriptional regulator
MTAPRPRDTRNKGVTRERVASAAAAVLDESGIERLSMRQVAVRLGVVPMALYNHVRSKEDLLALLADHLRAQVVVDPSASPRAQLLSLLTQLRDLGAKHPAMLDGGSSLNTSPYAVELALLELRLLAELGLTPSQVRVAYRGLVFLVAGAAVVWRARAAAPDEAHQLWELVHAAAEPADARRLDDLAALPVETSDEAFLLAVDQVLAAAAQHEP